MNNHIATLLGQMLSLIEHEKDVPDAVKPIAAQAARVAAQALDDLHRIADALESIAHTKAEVHAIRLGKTK